jgi:hypothetical protein
MPNDDEHETIENEERSCGFLKHSKAYVRSPPASGSGTLPSFVRFDPPIPYLERSKFRGYEYFPGISFELAVTGAADIPTTYAGMAVSDPDDDPRLDDEDADHRELLFEDHTFLMDAVTSTSEEIADNHPSGITSTDPPGEIWRHVARLTGAADGDHAGDVPAFHAHDLYMHIGASYYETPEEFIAEVDEQGLSKAIPVSESQDPPVINPGKTRLFLVHPDATGDENDTPGVIGYVYLWRTVYTDDEEGRYPHWAKQQSRSRTDMDLVHVGDKVYEDGTRETTIDDLNGDTSDKEGRDAGNALVEDTDIMDPVTENEEEFRDRINEAYMDPDVDASEVYAEEIAPVEDGEISDEDDLRDHARKRLDIGDEEVERLNEEEIRDQLDDMETDVAEVDEETENVGPETWVNAEVVEVPYPDECPRCESAVRHVEVDDPGTPDGVHVAECTFCTWTNYAAVNAAVVESNLRREDYNALQQQASEAGVHPGGNPSGDDLVRSLLDDMGLL